MKRRTLRNGLVIVGVAVLAGGWATAGIIESGVNHMKTQVGSVWDFSVEPIEEQKFGPGSDPFDGLVYVFTVTKVGHGESTELVGDLAGLPVEIVAMQLHSVEPVEVMFTDPDTGARVPKLYDVLVTPVPGAANTGRWKIQVAGDPAAPEGGTILADGPGDPDPEPIPPDSFFDVFFDFEFIPQDGSESIHVQRADHVLLTADVPWDSMAPAPTTTRAPAASSPALARPWTPTRRSRARRYRRPWSSRARPSSGISASSPCPSRRRWGCSASVG